MDFDRIAELAADEREAYRAGYLAKMASVGLSPGDVDAMLSSGGLEKWAFAPGNILKYLGIQHLMGGLGGSITRLPTAALIGIPVGLGGVAGWAAANMINPSKRDIDIMEQSALADEYRHQTNALHGEVARANRRKPRTRRSIGL